VARAAIEEETFGHRYTVTQPGLHNCIREVITHICCKNEIFCTQRYKKDRDCRRRGLRVVAVAAWNQIDDKSSLSKAASGKNMALPCRFMTNYVFSSFLCCTVILFVLGLGLVIYTGQQHGMLQAFYHLLLQLGH
jgi:hypothetical protein